MRLQRADGIDEGFLNDDEIIFSWFVWVALLLLGLMITFVSGGARSRHNQKVDHLLGLLGVASAYAQGSVDDSKDMRTLLLLRSLRNGSSEFHEHLIAQDVKKEAGLQTDRDFQRIQETLTTCSDSREVFMLYGPLILSAMDGQEITAEVLPTVYAQNKSFACGMLITWVVASFVWWAIWVVWHELGHGYHAFSSYRILWCHVLTFPGVIVLLPVVGVFYVGYACWCGLTRAAYHRRLVPQANVQHQPETSAADPGHYSEVENDRLRAEVQAEIAAVRADSKRSRKLFIRHAKQWHAESLANAKQAAERDACDLDELRRKASKSLAIWKTLRDQSQATLSAGYGTQFARLTSHPQVAAVAVQSNGMVKIYLKTLVVACGSRRYEVGDFRLHLDCKDFSFCVQCLRSTSRKATHPYWHGGDVCFGDAAKRELSGFFQRGDLYAFTDLAYEMMTRPNPEIMGYWKEVSREESVVQTA